MKHFSKLNADLCYTVIEQTCALRINIFFISFVLIGKKNLKYYKNFFNKSLDIKFDNDKRTFCN